MRQLFAVDNFDAPSLFRVFHHARVVTDRLAEAVKCDIKELEACWSAIAGDEDAVSVSSWDAFMSQHLETMCETELLAEPRADSMCLATVPKGSLLRVLGVPTEACCCKRQETPVKTEVKLRF